jgi:pimeloyl-ACP methyl ester carboxylesterase
MYHPSRFQSLLLAAGFSIQFFAAPFALASEAGKAPLTGAVAVAGEPNWPLPPNAKELKKRPKAVEIYQFDKTSIDNRAPLLMVHGLLGEYLETFRWRKLAIYLQSDPAFAKRYKIVFARYDTKAPMKEVSEAFEKEAIKVSDAFGGQPLNVVALSMGGNLLQNAMLDPAFDAHVKSVLTMGTPFHGSPLFTSNWMEYSMLRHYHSPISRLDTAFAYRMYFNRHKNLLSDLRWDNTDGFIPDVGNFKFYFPISSHGDLTPKTTANTVVAQLNQAHDVDKSKFTVYSGYLLNDFASMKSPNEFASILKLPYRVTFTLLPEHLGREHPVLRALNQHIARAIVSSPETVKADGARYAYGLNDGIAPITSSLFLPNSALDGLAVSDGNVQELRKLVDVKRARLFRNIDHLTFIDDYHPLLAAAELRDQLDPDEAPRPIFEWIKGDLLGVNELAEAKKH